MNILIFSDVGGFDLDFEEGFRWYRTAARKGNTSAQCNLGLCYSNGEGVEKNEKRAVKWWTKAAEKGQDMAQYSPYYVE